MRIYAFDDDLLARPAHESDGPVFLSGHGGAFACDVMRNMPAVFIERSSVLYLMHGFVQTDTSHSLN